MAEQSYSNSDYLRTIDVLMKVPSAVRPRIPFGEVTLEMVATAGTLGGLPSLRETYQWFVGLSDAEKHGCPHGDADVDMAYDALQDRGFDTRHNYELLQQFLMEIQTGIDITPLLLDADWKPPVERL